MICLCPSCVFPPSYTSVCGSSLAAVSNAIYTQCSISSLDLSVREDCKHPVDTHTSHSQRHKRRHTSTSTRTRKPAESSVQGRMCRKGDSSGSGRPVDLGLKARYREKANNFMPKCLKEEYTGNKSKHFFHLDRLQQLPSPL